MVWKFSSLQLCRYSNCKQIFTFIDFWFQSKLIWLENIKLYLICSLNTFFSPQVYLRSELTNKNIPVSWAAIFNLDRKSWHVTGVVFGVKNQKIISFHSIIIDNNRYRLSSGNILFLSSQSLISLKGIWNFTNRRWWTSD